KSPGNLKKTLARDQAERYSKDLETIVTGMLDEFAMKYPEEKSIQLGLVDRGTYQELVTVMDGIRKKIQDIVLISPDEVNHIKEDSHGS
ncbi:MAG: hypothetical protein KDD45_06925, partial [Bdellovibrionales bacterium]|nr:hypothetical protein [Bdellovibrionales bacterium]